MSVQTRDSCKHLYVSPCARLHGFLHRGFHLVDQGLSHAGCSEEQQLVGLEAFLNVTGRVGDPQSGQSVKLYRRKNIISYSPVVCPGSSLDKLNLICIVWV